MKTGLISNIPRLLSRSESLNAAFAISPTTTKMDSNKSWRLCGASSLLEVKPLLFQFSLFQALPLKLKLGWGLTRERDERL